MFTVIGRSESFRQSACLLDAALRVGVVSRISLIPYIGNFTRRSRLVIDANGLIGGRTGAFIHLDLVFLVYRECLNLLDVLGEHCHRLWLLIIVICDDFFGRVGK